MKCVLMFPGQGSHFTGMGEELFNDFKNETALAGDILGYDIVELCLKNPNDNLSNTKFAQPAIFFLSCLAYIKINQQEKYDVFCTTGHSLGEYAACYAAGMFSLETGLKMVKKRAELMSEVPNGGMAALIHESDIDISSTLLKLDANSIDIANYNTPNQTIISGPKNNLSVIGPKLERLKIKCIPLPVSGAFHSRYMVAPRASFMKFISTLNFDDPKTKVFSPTAFEWVERDYLIEILGYQFTRSVFWKETIKFLYSKDKHLKFIEVGPGEMLSKMQQSIV